MLKKIIGMVCALLTAIVALLPNAAYAGVFPRAESIPASTVNYINMEGESFKDVFMITSLQGNINRTQPSIYVVSSPLIDKPPVFSGQTGQYWLDKLSGYTKTQYTDKYRMVADFASGLSGCVLYDETIFNYTGLVKSFQPSDDSLAKLNVTAMLCGRYNAIALTADQRNKLISDYGVTLPILADTTTSAFSNWAGCYNYALNNLASYMRTDITAHNPQFLLADMDYIIAQKIFTYNRILNPTTAQAEIEDQILELCGDNTPVIGVWHLQQDEGGLVHEVTSHGRFFTVTYETWNLSWTTGLPMAAIPDQSKRNLSLDNDKVYIAFNVTEGDNTSFLYHTLPGRYDQQERTAYPIGFTMVNTLNELAPNMASYFYNSMNGSSTLITPESGVGYTNPITPESNRSSFFNLTNSYMATMKTSVIKTMWNNMEQALPYAEIPNVNGVLVGYRGSQMGGNEPTVDGVKDTNFSYKGKPFFKNYDFSHMNDIVNYNGPTPAFFSISALGWNVSPKDIKEVCDKLPSNFVVVSPEEMTDLYKSYYNPRFTEVTEAEFDTCTTAGEMGFLDTNHSSVDSANKIRYADLDNYWVYKFDLNDNAAGATIQMDLQNNYRVHASSDNINWTEIAAAPADTHDGSNRTMVCRDISSYLTGNSSKTVYIKISDGSTGDGWGPGLRHIKLLTDMSRLGKHTMKTTGNGEEASFLYQNQGSWVSDGNYRVADGNQYWVYQFHLKNDSIGAAVTMDLMNNYRVAVSTDAADWTEVAAASSDIHDGSNRTELTCDISSYLVGNSSKTVYFKFYDGSIGDGWGAALHNISLFTESSEITGMQIKTTGNGEETPYLFDNKGSYLIYGNQQGRRVADGSEYFTYRLNFEDNVTKARAILQLENNYKVFASTDNSAWTQICAAPSDIHDGSNRAEVAADITAFLSDNPGKTVYLKFADGSPSDGWGTALGKITIVTNRTQLDSESIPVRGDGMDAPYMNQNSGSYIYSNSARIADGTAYWIYKLDMKDEVARAGILLDIGNNYKISVSKDGSNWTEAAAASYDAHDMGNRAWVPVNLAAFLESNPQKTVYVKFSDGSTGDGWGAALFNIKLITDQAQMTGLTVAAKGDGQELPYMESNSGSFIAGNDHRAADGSGYWIYRVDLEDSTLKLGAWADVMNNYRMAVSKDGTNFTEIAAASQDIHDGSNRTTVKLDLTSYLKQNPGKTIYFKFYDGSPEDGWGASLYSLNLFTDKTQWTSVSINTDGQGEEIPFIEWDSAIQAGGAKTTPYGSGITYRFDLADNKTSLNMVIDIANNYAIYATSDPTAAYTLVARSSSDIHDESNRTNLNADLTAYLTNNPSKVIYLYIGNGDPYCEVGAKFRDITLN